MRNIRVNWWYKPYIMRLYIGDDISCHDLYMEEMEALVDDLEFRSYDENYNRPRPQPVPPTMQWWYCFGHRSQPGHTICAEYGCDGDCWTINYCGCCFHVTKEEANGIVRQFRMAQEELKPVVGSWKTEGF